MATATSRSVNYWSQRACAKAFWGQQELPPYRELLRDTLAWLDPQPGQHWLDLGCGGGQLTRGLWELSGGTLTRIDALDCAAANEQALATLRRQMSPPAEDEIVFLHADFSHGLAAFGDSAIDGVVSGLAIHYAESFDAVSGRWTTAAYEALLADVQRVLRPGASFVFSVCVPRANWWIVAYSSILGFFASAHPVDYLKRAYRMLRYGSWLQSQVKIGRFHYLPIEVVREKLAEAGFVAVEDRVSFAGQAYLVRCKKPQ